MFRGSMVALVTPMRDDGAVDFAALDRLVDFHLESGTHAIVAVGTTGEASTLDVDEHIGVVEAVVRRVHGRIPVIAGTGANATREAIDLTRRATDVGADACLLVTPYYNKPTQEGLYQHFRAVAEATSVPILLYNVPGRTACDMLAKTVIRLAGIPRIVGVKEATGDIGRGAAIRAATPPGFALISGDDASAVELAAVGATGVISVTANVAPAQMHAVWEAVHAGALDRARELDRPLAGLHKNLFVESNPIPVKWALQEMGLCGGHLRLPLTPLATEKRAHVREALAQGGILA
ncbi:MAG: 4-hydroxy-tetrahydrodipicolinate synthase [Gammaproteobacteria bacterium]|nr:4-hydroxy-tetrahydrodipicolinate synthase [Gammaproteobacteria bacterium]